MKFYSYVILLLAVVQTGNASSEKSDTNAWGIIKCDAQMSVRPASNHTHFKIEGPIRLTIRIKNVSQHTIYLFDNDPQRDFAFTITSPAGKTLEPKVPPVKEGEEEYRRKIIALQPNDIREYQVNLRDIYEIKKVGTYKAIAKRRIMRPGEKSCEIDSNPLDLVLTN